MYNTTYVHLKADLLDIHLIRNLNYDFLIILLTIMIILLKLEDVFIKIYKLDIYKQA